VKKAAESKDLKFEHFVGPCILLESLQEFNAITALKKSIEAYERHMGMLEK